jgi:Xaa-Pro aminopeptidase
MKREIGKILELMGRLSLDGVFLADNDNLLFYSGLPITKSAVNPVLDVLQQFNPAVMLIMADGRKAIFASASLAQYIEENMPEEDVYYYPTNLFIDYWTGVDKTRVYAPDIRACMEKYLLAQHLKKGRFGCDCMFQAGQGAHINEALGNSLIAIGEQLDELRFVKPLCAIDKMRRASRAAYQAIEKTGQLVEAGGEVYEADLFYLAREILLSHRCQWNFTTVACGKYSADIFHQPLNYRLCPGDAVRLDIGAVYGGYGSDIAATFFFPTPDEAYVELYRVLCEAQQKVLEEIRSGAITGNLFQIGQNYVREHGYPQYTRSMIGHGVGIQTEEKPFLRPGGRDVLQEGMVMSIELPYYIKDLAGLNIEDIILVTRDGFEYLK